MDNPLQLQLEELFFPLQDVRANPEHDQQGERSGTLLHCAHQLAPIDGQPGRYALNITVRSDNENSRNAPYTFMIEGYAVISTSVAADNGAESTAVLTTSLPVILGAIRERLAELTSRAPWGRFLMDMDVLAAIQPAFP